LASLCTQKTISYNIIVKGPVSALTFMDRVWKSKSDNDFGLVKCISKQARHCPFSITKYGLLLRSWML
jgi:hypothetical protein